MADSVSPAAIESFTASDGYEWRFRNYIPTGPVKSQVVCLHGIQSHGAWYEYSCAKLAQSGHHVYFLDRRGSGLNEKDRGDAPSFRRLLDDLGEFVQKIRTEADRANLMSCLGGPLPIFLVALSWGGKLGVGLQRRHPGLVDGLALLCPGFFPRVKPPFLQRLGIVLSRLFRPRRLYPIPLSDPELFTANPARQQFIREDRLGLRQASARLLIESVRLDGYKRLAAKYVTMPVLLMLAENDRIIYNDKTRRFVEGLPAIDKQIIEYPGAHHTLEFELTPDRFIQDLQVWIERHCGANSMGTNSS